MKKLLSIIICVSVFFSCFSLISCKKNNLDPSQLVDFVINIDEDREVRILQLTDVQIIDAAQRRYESRLSDWAKANWTIDNIETLAYRYIRNAINQTNPDLIVLTGDNVYGEFDDEGTSCVLLVDFMDSFKIPWTLTYGNHDNETVKGASWQNMQYENSKYCLFKRGQEDAEGNGNFTIGITHNNKLIETLFLLDSHGCVNADKEERVYSTPGIYEGQKEWYKSVNERIKKNNGGKNVKSLVFLHQALRAFGNGLQYYGYTSIKNDFFDSNGDAKKFTAVTIPTSALKGDYGSVNEDCNFIDDDYSFFNLLKTYGSEGVFFGHNHTNGCSVEFEGIRLTYGLKTGEYDSHIKSITGGTLISVSSSNFSVTPKYFEDALNE